MRSVVIVTTCTALIVSVLGSGARAQSFQGGASDFAAMNQAYAAFWPTDPPARTTVVVSQLSNVASLVEIAMVAVPNGGERIVIQPRAWMKPPSPYSYGIRTGKTCFCQAW
jgi:hypothetical protein